MSKSRSDDPIRFTCNRLGVVRHLFIGIALAVIFAMNVATAAAAEVSIDVENAIEKDGVARVIIGLDMDFTPEGEIGGQDEIAAQRKKIKKLQSAVLAELPNDSVSSVTRFRFVPGMAMHTDKHALERLAELTLVLRITPDLSLEPALQETVPIIGVDKLWAAGYSGKGHSVVVVDTGVDPSHPFFQNKIVAEACFGDLCPSGEGAYPGAGVPCSTTQTFEGYICAHGTKVAGIAVGSGTSAGVGFSGVAKDANLIPIGVYSTPVGFTLYASDLVQALEQSLSWHDDYKIASVNLSLGKDLYSKECDSKFPVETAAIENLRSVGVGVIIASHNQSSSKSIAYPACISSSISVGATTEADQVADFSNSAPFLDLLAPGKDVTTSWPLYLGFSFSPVEGTSHATPHVAGAWAVLKSKKSCAGVDEVEKALKDTGKPIFGKGIAKPRIQVDAAASQLTAFPVDSTASSTSQQTNVVDIVTRDTDSEVWFRSLKGKRCAAWEKLDGQTNSAPSITSSEPGTLDVFRRTLNDTIRHKQFRDSSWGTWKSTGAGTTTKPVAVTSQAPGSLDLFARFVDGTINYKQYKNGQWGSWVNLGGSTDDGPAAVSTKPRQLNIFITSTSGKLMQKTHKNGAWSKWRVLDGRPIGAVAVTSQKPGEMNLVARFKGDTVHHRSYKNGKWGSWVNLGGQATLSPSIVSIKNKKYGLSTSQPSIPPAGTPDALKVFARFPDKQIYRNTLRGGTWDGWKAIG